MSNPEQPIVETNPSFFIGKSSSQWTLGHPELPEHLFPVGMSDDDTALRMSHRIWFAREPIEKEFQKDCAMIGQLTNKLMLRRAEFVNDFLTDCTQAESAKIAEFIPSIYQNPKPEQVSYASAREFLKKSETFVPSEDVLVEDVVWYLRASICVLQRARAEPLPDDTDITQLIDDLVRTHGDEPVSIEDRVAAATQILTAAHLDKQS